MKLCHSPMEASGTDDKRLRTRKALISAARDLVYERGHERISIQDITARAKLGTGTFYNYFATKTQVFEAVLDDFRQSFERDIEAVRIHLKDPAMIVAVTLKYYFHQAQDNDSWNTFVTYSGLAGEHVLHQEQSQCLEDIQRGISAGRFKVDDACFAQVLVTGMIRHTNLEISKGVLGRSAMENTSRYILRMLGLPDLVAKALVQSPLPPVRAQKEEPASSLRIVNSG
jgi:AcrR family transcriptional regulator